MAAERVTENYDETIKVLGRVLDILYTEYNRVEPIAYAENNEEKKQYYRRLTDDLNNRITGVIDAISVFQAKSLEAAAIQMRIAMLTSDEDDRVNRCLYSALDVVEGKCGMRRDRYAGRFFAAAELNPFGAASC